MSTENAQIIHYSTEAFTTLYISTFSEKGDQQCLGHDFLMSRSAVHYVLLCFFQKRGLEITVFLFFDFSFLGNFVLTTLFLFEILVIASLGGTARRT